VTDDYPCAGLVSGPVVSVFRAIDIAAAPERVYPWLCQLKIAPYSYDLIDNLGRRSPRTLTPGVEQLQAGQKWIMVFRIASFEPGRHITGTTRDGRFGHQACTYRVRPAGIGSRLVVRLDMSVSSALRGATAPALAWGDLPMMRKQLLTIRELAEHPDQNSSGSV
jgi:hypothetical protein